MKPLKGNQQLGYGSQGVLCGAPGVKTQNLLPEEEGALDASTDRGPDTIRCEAVQANRWLRCQPSSYVRLEAYGFFGLSEGA